MASGTRWYPYLRAEGVRQSWLLDDGTVMEEPALEQSSSRRRVRLAGVPDCSDWMKDVNTFIVQAASASAQAKRRKLWIALGKDGENALDKSRATEVKSTTFSQQLVPHFMGDNRRAYDQVTRVAWRYRHPKMPIEAQIEASVEKSGYRDAVWVVKTKLIYTGTWPGNVNAPQVYMTDKPTWGELIKVSPHTFEDLRDRLQDWTQSHPIDWTYGWQFGAQRFEEERAAVNAFAKLVRQIDNLDAVEIPNLLHVDDQGENVDKIEMLVLDYHGTNASQELLEQLTDFLSGTPVVEQIKEKWLELGALFRRLGMVLEDPKDTELWNFVVQGADAAPLEVKLGPVEDDTHSTSHAVKINLATGTIVVACSKSTSRDDAAVQWETSLIKAEMTGQKDRFLAFTDHFLAEQKGIRVEELMQEELERANPNKEPLTDDGDED